MRSTKKKPQKKTLDLINTCFERSVTVIHTQFTSLVKCLFVFLQTENIPFLDLNTTNETFVPLSLLHFKVPDETKYLY